MAGGNPGTALLGALIGFGLSIAISFGFLLFVNKKFFGPLSRLNDYARSEKENGKSARVPSFGDDFADTTDLIAHLYEQIRKLEENGVKSENRSREIVVAINHSVKNPINSIRDIAEMLRSRIEPGKERSQLEIIRKKAISATEIINDITRQYPEEELNETFDIKQHSSLEIYDIISNADYDKACSYIGAIPKAMLVYDEPHFQDTLDHIVANCYKYAGTRITIHTEIIGDKLRLLIRDYGNGIPPEEFEHVTHKNFRGGNAAGKTGQGIGLYLSSRYMEQMNGSLRCENMNNGFGVTLSIPLDPKTVPEQMTLAQS